MLWGWILFERKIYGCNICNAPYLHNLHWHKAPVSNTWIPMSTFISLVKIKIEASKIRVLNCVQTKQFNCKLINLIVNECSLTLENNGLSQSEQWWHDINVIKSCRVMLRTFPSTLHPPRHILMSLTAKYFQSQCLKTLSELCCRDGADSDSDEQMWQRCYV